MNRKSKAQMRALEFRKLREDYDYIWQNNGKAIPTTKGKLEKFAQELITVLDNRLNNAKLFRSNTIITKLPENLAYIEENTDSSGIREVKPTKKDLKKEKESLSETSG